MVSMLKSISIMSCGVVLCLSLPTTTQAINNLTAELEELKADETADRLSGVVKQEEETPEGVSTIRGEVLHIKRNHYLVRKYTGDLIHLRLDANTTIIGTVHQGDRIVARVNDERHVLLIHSVQ